MKITELRIGNIVKQGTIVELRFNAARVKYTLDGKERMSLIDYRNLEAVPLTEEWLLKPGFVYGILEDESFQMVMTYYDGWLFKYEEKQEFMPTSCFTGNILYVHELQNLVHSLCGKELELTP